MLGAASARGRRGKEGQQDKPKAQQGRIGGITCSPCFLCNDGLCWQPVGWVVMRTLEHRWDNPSVGHFMSFEDIFRHLQIHASVSCLQLYSETAGDPQLLFSCQELHNYHGDPKLPRERVNPGTHIAKIRWKETALAVGRGMATLLERKLCLPSTLCSA